jgi:hypothetical protein
MRRKKERTSEHANKNSLHSMLLFVEKKMRSLRDNKNMLDNLLSDFSFLCDNTRKRKRRVSEREENKNHSHELIARKNRYFTMGEG